MATENVTTSTETTATETPSTEAVETTTPNVDELIAQITQLTADRDKYKSANDKLSKSEAEMKRQLRAKLTAEEQEAEAKAEADRVRDEELKTAKAELNHIRAVNAYKAISDEKAVETLIEAVSDADHNAIAQIIANECKKAVAEAEAKWLKDRPRVNHGQYSGMTREQIMAIPDSEERLKAIAMNSNLF